MKVYLVVSPDIRDAYWLQKIFQKPEDAIQWVEEAQAHWQIRVWEVEE